MSIIEEQRCPVAACTNMIGGEKPYSYVYGYAGYLRVERGSKVCFDCFWKAAFAIDKLKPNINPTLD